MNGRDRQRLEKKLVQFQVRLARIVQRHIPPAYRDDVLQDIWLKTIERLDTYDVNKATFWGWFRELIPFFGFFGILAAAGVGYLVGEAISRSVNRKRGTLLQVIGGVCFAISYVVSNIGLSESGFTFYFNPWGILALGVGVFVATSRLR